MMISKAVMKAEAMRGSSPKEMLYKANNIIAADNDTTMFVTVFCAVLDLRTGELEYGNAGHNPPLICRSGQGYEYMDIESSFVFGPMPDMEFSGGKIKLNPNDVIFLYTDGITEAMNSQNQLFSDPRLQETLSNLGGKEVEEILPEVRESIREFVKDAPQSDDITMLALKFIG